jgi:hypothetical protein
MLVGLVEFVFFIDLLTVGMTFFLTKESLFQELPNVLICGLMFFCRFSSRLKNLDVKLQGFAKQLTLCLPNN